MNKTQIIVLTNDFHNTEIKLRARINGNCFFLTNAQIKHAKKVLCPNKDCQCSGPSGLKDDNWYLQVEIKGATLSPKKLIRRF
jgi:hypothetical protein